MLQEWPADDADFDADEDDKTKNGFRSYPVFICAPIRVIRGPFFCYAVATTTEYPRFSITSHPPNASKISGTTAVGIFVTM